MSTYTASTLNTLFTQQLDTSEGREKLAAAGASYIRERLRETSFARKILPPEQVTKADCQRSVDHDGLVKIVDIEPQSRAMAINFRSAPDARYISAPRFEVAFYTISSERFEKAEQELQAYEMPITKVIEQNSVKDIQAVEDTQFTQSSRLATIETQKVLLENKLGLDAKSDLTDLFDQLDDFRLLVGSILMCKSQLNKWMAMDHTMIGDVLSSEIAKDGYRYNTLLGHKLLTTTKTQILSPREIFVFAEPDYLGKFYILNNTKFYIDKRANFIEWQAWEDIGMAFGSIDGIARVIFTDGIGGALDGLETVDWGVPAQVAQLSDPAGLGVIPLDEGTVFAP